MPLFQYKSISCGVGFYSRVLTSSLLDIDVFQSRLPSGLSFMVCYRCPGMSNLVGYLSSNAKCYSLGVDMCRHVMQVFPGVGG